MISMRLELELFRAGMDRLIAMDGGDLAEQSDAELRVEQLRELRLRMRGQRGMKGDTGKTPHVVSYERGQL